MARLLVVDDEPDFCESLRSGLQEGGHLVRSVATGADAIKAASADPYDVVLLDLGLPDRHGLEVLAELRSRLQRTPVIVITGEADMSSTVRAMRDGAFDFLSKPVAPEELEARIDRALRLSSPARGAQPVEIDDEPPQETAAGPVELIGGSGAMREVFKQLGLLSASRATVLIRGESGTGKELAARILHEFSIQGGPFVAVNCAALPAGLIEAEIFGHRKGAFTGADKDRAGKLEAAGEGTLFLDEIGEVPLDVQVKLLRVLQERQFERLGETESRPFRARVVAATHRDLEALVREGRFREDLYYRLNVATVTLPPLRARRDDVPLIARRLLRQICGEVGRPTLGLSAGTLERLLAHDWPGNVRELRNVLTRAVLRARGGMILEDDLELDSTTDGRPLPTTPTDPRPNGRLPTLEEAERELIRRALEHTGGHRGKTCELLGISRPRLLRKIRRYGLESRPDDDLD